MKTGLAGGKGLELLEGGGIPTKWSVEATAILGGEPVPVARWYAHIPYHQALRDYPQFLAYPHALRV